VLPTPEGYDFYVKCNALAEKFADAEAHIQSLDGSPRGKLKIASSVAFGKSQLIPVLPKFLEAYPDVSVALDLTDRDIDIEAESFDAAICFAEQRKMSDIVVRKFMHSRRILCAAPVCLDLSRFGAAPLIAYYATKEMNYGTNTGE
jgi:DNA-binding transcriptional LysR family regulator